MSRLDQIRDRPKIKNLSAPQRLRRIAEIIEGVDQRCMAADGPVTPTEREINAAEILHIYLLASSPSSPGEP